MHLIRVGHLSINLEYLILAEDSEREPEPRSLPAGVLRVTLESGRVLDLRGGMADEARRQLDQVVNPPPGDSREPSMGRAVPVNPKRSRSESEREGR